MSEVSMAEMTEAEELIALEMRDPQELDVELPALIEALLLVASGPVAIADLSEVAGARVSDIEDAVDRLAEIENRGWVVQRHRDQVSMATAPRFAGHIRRFLGLEREARLSPAALETVAIIAYQQPVTKSTIEAIRGVDSSGVVATLLSRGLIETSGRAETPGQPYLYVTTPAFLRHFGLSSLDDLPPLGASDGVALSDVLQAKVDEAEREAPGLELVGASVLVAADDSAELANP
ncbi:MAG: SMC-Scp complex subunit ScpB [Thermomicrobiales bacterium]|nr:SMC-Scp complex subunit ScpB [Thermomicrobiales bacterium]